MTHPFLVALLLVTLLLVSLWTTSAAAEDIEQLRADADALVTEGERWAERAEPSRARARFAAAGKAYLAIWEGYGADPCRASQPACQRFEEVLFKANQAFHAAQMGSARIATLKVLVDPAFHLAETKLGQRAAKELGDAYLAINVFDLAADWYEKLARESPKSELAPEALENAVILRLGLSQIDQAVALARLFARNYSIRRRAHNAAVAFAVVDTLIRRGDHVRAKKIMSAHTLTRDQAGHDMAIRSRALVARVLRLNRDAKALDAYRRVIHAWQTRRSDDHIERLKQQGGSEETQRRRIGDVLTDVGEALFYEAEEARAIAGTMKPPKFKGPSSTNTFREFQTGPLQSWLSQRKQAINDAEIHYLEIVKLPYPPPRWTVAAHERVASMWEDLRRDLIQAAYPSGVTAPSTLEDLGRRIRWVYHQCADFSVRYQEFGEPAQRCQAWLTADSTSSGPRLTELAPTVGARNSTWRYAPLPEPE